MASLYVTVVFTGAPVIVKASSLLSASAELLVLMYVLCCYLGTVFLGCVTFRLFVCSVAWLFLLGCQYQCKWLTGKTRLQN